MEPKSPSKSKIHVMGFIQSPITLKCGKVVILISFILVLIFGFFVFSPNVILYVRKRASYFTVVLDCGSTGTRVNVYEWMFNGGSMNNGEFPILVNSYPGNLTRSDGCKYHCVQTEPGLAMFVGNASGLRASLKPLIRGAEKWVPSGKRGVTPIFVLATAGMRRLPIEDASRIMEGVADIVKEHGFFYRKDFIRVLSGREEAYYGWVALNYKMGTLGNTSESHTLGLLDLGGSSLQVVTEIDEFRADEHVFRSKIGLVEHKLLAYSLQAFGFNEAIDRALAILSHTQAPQESTGKIFEVRHPCLSSGFVQNYTCRGCLGQKPSSSEDSSSRMMTCELNSILVLGDPNWEQCKALATEVATNLSNLERSKVAEQNCVGLLSYGSDRMQNLTLNSHKVTRYHALSGFFVVYNMLNLSSRANLTKLWETGQRLCSRSWADQTNANGLCFRILYMASLIQEALCLSNLEIIFGPGDVSWTLGAALIEGTESQRKGVATEHKWMVSSSITLFLVLVCVLIIVYRSQIKLPMPGRKITSGRASLPSYLYPKLQPN
ncbi:probable apyrase 7 isoform X1 [Ipomoea triloba]|uniref:probable apyrase 7 isoform X1 n=2 Tax=Ipomoea triloba TaxID=35885 RepID=UPI00125E8D30|nr:probable apyrase 7 isoform X1 [Ipomoea triloba]